MKERPIIGIFSARQEGPLLPLYRTTGHYVEQVAAAGGIPIQLPLLPGTEDAALDDLLALCDGILLPGGADLDPGWYGETLLPTLPQDARGLPIEVQDTAIRLIRRAAASGKVILGICLGCQAITAALGGKLYQDIPTQHPSGITHGAPVKELADRWAVAHTVKTEEGSLIRRLCGEEIPVNSFHHQAVKTPAPGFSVTAYAPDGIIEAVERENGRILGVQWHPENLAHAGDPQAKALFAWLVETAKE